MKIFEPDVQYFKRSPLPVTSISSNPTKYAVVIDAGSSGSRVQVFSWTDPSILQKATPIANTTILNSVPEITQDPKHNLKINPGLSSFAGKTDKIWNNHLSKLIRHAEKGIPRESRHETPVYLLATAGMRLLPAADQQDILSTSCALLQQKSSFYLPDCNSHVSIIDGETEALYGWLSLNYLLGTFNSYKHTTQDSSTGYKTLQTEVPVQHPSYGFMDMGGASMQVAFSPNATESERHFNDLFQVRLRSVDGKNQNWKVFVSTWLGFGANEAKRRFAQYLLDYNKVTDTDKPDLMLDPCYPRGTLHNVAIDANTTVEFAGMGNFTQCLQTMQPLLRKDLPCKDYPCLFNGVHVPAIDFRTDRFVGVSEYWYTANDIFKLGGKYDFKTFSEHVNSFCGSTWDKILKDKKSGKLYKGVTETALESACFKASWVINILHSGFGLPFDHTDTFGLDSYSSLQPRSLNFSTSPSYRNLNKRDLRDFVTPFQSVSSIEGTELTWMLGRVVLYASSQVPPTSSRLPDVGFLPAEMSDNHYVLGGEISGVSPPMAPSLRSPVDLTFGLLIVFGCLMSVFYYFYTKRKRGINWGTGKIRVIGLPKLVSRIVNKFRGYPGDNGYQRVLEEGSSFIGMDSIPAPPIASSPAAFYVPLAVSAKSTSMLDLSKLHDDTGPINRVPSRPPSRVSSRMNLSSARNGGDSERPVHDQHNIFLSPPDAEVNITRSSSRLFHNQSAERLPIPRP